MTNYTVRSCHCCGVRKPQPEMTQKEIYVETGKSQSSISKATALGAFFGDKKSVSAINRWALNTNQRTYKRKNKLWLCKTCEPTFVDPSTIKTTGEKIADFIGNLIVLAFVGFIIMLFVL